MNPDYDDCLKRGKIKPFSRGRALAGKELETAAADLSRAVKTFEEKDYKWATIQVYYAMFHAARSLLYSKNLREHSHYCLAAAIKELFVDAKQVPVKLLEAFKEAKNLREDADYYGRWSETGCSRLIDNAGQFVSLVEKLIRQ